MENNEIAYIIMYIFGSVFFLLMVGIVIRSKVKKGQSSTLPPGGGLLPGEITKKSSKLFIIGVSVLSILTIGCFLVGALFHLNQIPVDGDTNKSPPPISFKNVFTINDSEDDSFIIQYPDNFGNVENINFKGILVPFPDNILENILVIDSVPIVNSLEPQLTNQPLPPNLENSFYTKIEIPAEKLNEMFTIIKNQLNEQNIPLERVLIQSAVFPESDARVFNVLKLTENYISINNNKNLWNYLNVYDYPYYPYDFFTLDKNSSNLTFPCNNIGPFCLIKDSVVNENNELEIFDFIINSNQYVGDFNEIIFRDQSGLKPMFTNLFSELGIEGVDNPEIFTDIGIKIFPLDVFNMKKFFELIYYSAERFDQANNYEYKKHLFIRLWESKEENKAIVGCYVSNPANPNVVIDTNILDYSSTNSNLPCDMSNKLYFMWDNETTIEFNNDNELSKKIPNTCSIEELENLVQY